MKRVSVAEETPSNSTSTTQRVRIASMSSINVFIIHRPYQVLNATEYATRTGLAQCHLFVVEDEKLSAEYFADIADTNVWESIQVWPLRDWFEYADLSCRRPATMKEVVMEKVQLINQIWKRRTIEKLARRIGPVNELVLGSYRRSYAEYMRHLATRIPHRKLVLIDVGTDTLEINRQRHEEFTEALQVRSGAPRQDASLFHRLRGMARSALVDWNTRGAASVTFFSSYELDVSPADEFILNDYRNLRRSLTNRSANGETWFLGQPIADQQYLSWDSFGELIDGVAKKYGPGNLVYVPHPYESDRQLTVVENAGIRVRRFDKPIEVILSRANEIPAALSGFFSSAITGCAAIFGSTLEYEAIRIPDTMLQKQQDNLEEIYRCFAENDPQPIRVVHLAHA